MRSKAAVLILSLLALCISCTRPDDISHKSTTLSMELEAASVQASDDGIFIYVKVDGSWTLALQASGGESIGWARLNKTSGSGEATVVLTCNPNESREPRSLTIVLSAPGAVSVSKSFTQEGKADTPIPPDPPTPDTINPDPVADWMELPAVPEGLYFFTHPMTIDGKKLRNYSYVWDVDNMVAHWVAYPLNSRLMSGNCGRSDAWGLDPKLPTKDQPVLYKAYSNTAWARGHQIPSADRQIYEYNVQTFYGVNMTPQNQNFNGGIWGNLEGYVRSRSSSFDTLYVVTGCTLEGSKGKVYDNNGKPVTIPGGYFKALLGYKQSKTIGNTSIQAGYTGIAFFFKNESGYDGKEYMKQAMTISELEEKVGIDFFVNLPAAIGNTLATKVETTPDSWWNR